MRVKVAIKKVVAPILEGEGFLIYEVDPRAICFSDCNDNIRISIGYNSMVNSLDIVCFFRLWNGSFQWFEPHYMSHDLLVLFIYNTQQELETNLGLISDVLTNEVIPFLRHLIVQHVAVPLTCYNELLINPKVQADKFAEHNKLSVKYCSQNVEFVEQLLDKFRGDDLNKRRSRFEEHFPCIVNVTAYYGELIRDKCPKKTKWMMNEIGGMIGLQIENHQGWIYPYSNVIQYWNYNPFISYATLKVNY